VALELDPGGRLEADVVLVCAGRQASTASLNLAAAGIVAGKRGQLDVDAQFATNVKHVAACGDVIGFPSLASTSMEQARVAVVHFFDLKYKTKLAPIFPYGIYTIPEVSMCGDTEAALKEKKIEYVKGVANFGDNARGLIIGEHGKLKLLFQKSDLKLLGVHCIGEGATEIVHIGLMAMMSQAGADLFIETCFNYPTLSEAYKYATYDALGRRGRGA
jgi:NAD(P) transhydrogenase